MTLRYPTVMGTDLPPFDEWDEPTRTAFNLSLDTLQRLASGATPGVN